MPDLDFDVHKIIGSVSQCLVLRLMTDQHVSPLLVGAYVNSMMYTLEGIAVIQYYLTTKRNQDSLLFQVVVYFTFVVDTVSTCVTCAFVYLVCNRNRIIIFSNLILMMSLFFTVYCHTLGYNPFIFHFSFRLTGYQCPYSTTGDHTNLQTWLMAVTIALNGITGSIVQCFLIYRYWRMSVISVFIRTSAIPNILCLGAKTITSHLY